MAPLDKVQYTAKVHTTGGRDGEASRSSDGRLDIKLSVPGTPGTGTNPEQLLAAGWSTCFVSSIKIVAARMNAKLPPGLAVDAEVDLCRNEGGFFLQARINVSLPGVDQELAENLVAEADQTCPYSKATRGNIGVAINVATPRALVAASPAA
ncbi:MAG: organic hydroperoxide resistance protein [Acidobacteriaceae bacterium]|jgi:Ohr subfamily peroxiredoxin